MFVTLHVVALLLMALARRLPHTRVTALRLAIANIHRPGALTPTIVLSLGLGLALLVTVIEIDGNLRRQFMAALPERAPSFYFVDIQSADADRFDAFVRERAPRATLERVPMLRGRIMSRQRRQGRGPQAAAKRLLGAAERPRHHLRRRGAAGSRLVEGQWWGADYHGPPLVSFEKKIAEGLGLKVGDPVTVNVLGRNITRDGRQPAHRRLAEPRYQLRAGVLAQRVRRRAAHPHRHADLSGRRLRSREEIALLKAVGDAFPAVTTVRVKEALDAVGGMVRNLVLAIRGASVVALVAAVLVLGGALAAGHRHRVYDAVVLKTLGATRGRLIGAYALEYVLLGAATALFGVAAGSIAAWLVVTEVMNLSFVWLPGPAAAAAFGALLVTVAFGLIGTFTALGHKPAPVLRNL